MFRAVLKGVTGSPSQMLTKFALKMQCDRRALTPSLRRYLLILPPVDLISRAFEMPGKAMASIKFKKTLCGRESAPKPAGEAYSALQ